MRNRGEQMKRFKLIKEREVQAIVDRYPHRRSALLPVLWLVQEQEGWVPPEAYSYVAGLTGLTEAQVREVVSFYTLFNRRRIGRHHIQVCLGPCCRLRGADRVLEDIKSILEIEVGQSTSDGRFHLSIVECLGSCGTAPMMQIDDDYYENLSDERIAGILQGFST